MQTFHFPLCLVLGTGRREPEASAQLQTQMAPLHPHADPQTHPVTMCH